MSMGGRFESTCKLPSKFESRQRDDFAAVLQSFRSLRLSIAQ